MTEEQIQYDGMSYRKQSDAMARWSMILGVASILLSLFIIPSIILGAISVILGFLSRGGSTKYPGPAIAGIITGIMGIRFGIICFALGFYLLIEQYGSYENFLNEYMTYLNSYYGSSI